MLHAPGGHCSGAIGCFCHAHIRSPDQRPRLETNSHGIAMAMRAVSHRSDGSPRLDHPKRLGKVSGSELVTWRFLLAQCHQHVATPRSMLWPFRHKSWCYLKQTCSLPFFIHLWSIKSIPFQVITRRKKDSFSSTV